MSGGNELAVHCASTTAMLACRSTAADAQQAAPRSPGVELLHEGEYESEMRDQIEATEAALLEARQVEALRLAVANMEGEVTAEAEALSRVQQAHTKEFAELQQLRQEAASIESRLRTRQRVDERQQRTTKLLQVQLSLASQIHELAEGLMQLPPARADGGTATHPEHEHEVEVLKKALKHQKKITHEAQQQLLELSRHKQRAAIGTRSEETERLRAALLEQEVGRVAAEAKVEELQGQLRLLEQEALRKRLHPAVDANDDEGYLPPQPAKPTPRVIIPFATRCPDPGPTASRSQQAR